jgi:hypothetical protein
MTDRHPITPPPELVQQWFDEANTKETMADVKEAFANSAAQWGADQELEACCEWHRNRGYSRFITLREDRRPNPPSLKEQALSHLENAYDADMIDDTTFENIRQVLEALPE